MRWVRLLFLSVGRAALCFACFMSDWLWENKTGKAKCCTFGKTSAVALGEPLERWGALDWVGENTTAKQTAFFYLIG